MIYRRCVFLVAFFVALHTCAALAAGVKIDGVEQQPQPGAVDLVWQAYIAHAGVELQIEVHYPQGLQPAVDAKLGSDARKAFDDTCREFLEGAADMAEEVRASVSASPPPDGVVRGEHLLSAAGSYVSARTYQILRPSPGVASVWYSIFEYTGGAHGNLLYDVVTFDVEKGKALDLSDIFADVPKAREGLVPLVAQGVRAQKKPGAQPVDGSADAIDLTMRRIALTPEGMRVVYAPYEMGSYSEGPFHVDIPKAALLQLGARPELWSAPRAE